MDVEYDDNDTVEITSSTTADVPNNDRSTVMYKYIKRPEASDDDLIDNSRGFSVKLINNNRLYKRSEIEQMTQILGYDVANMLVVFTTI